MSSTKAIKVLYCCSDSDEDEQMRQKLEEEHFAILRRDGTIATWDKSMISPGKEWENEFNSQLQTADIILILMSPKFIACDYNWNVAEKAIERHKARISRLVVIWLRPVDSNWKFKFRNIRILPDGDKPITEYKPYDKVFANIAEGIRAETKELLISRSPIQKSLRYIEIVTNIVGNAFSALAIATGNTATAFFSSSLRSRSSRRRKKADIMSLAIVSSACVAAIWLFRQVPEVSKIPSLEFNQTPSPTLSFNSKQNVNASGWIRIGVINKTSVSPSAGEPLLESSAPQLAPSIDSPIVPSIGAVVTVKKPVNLRENRQQIKGVLKPPQKLIILKLQPSGNSDSEYTEVWAEVAKCTGACNK